MRTLATLGAVLLALGPADAQDAPQAPTPDRFQLVESNAREVLVLDAYSGVLFAVNLAGESAMMIDPLQGRAIARPLVSRQRDTALEAAPLTWPSRAELAQRGSERRFQTADAGSPAVFDTATGRLYLLDGPDGLRVIDPVEGVLELRGVQLDDTAVALAPVERDVVAALHQIVGAQLAFQSGDPDKDQLADFGDLRELGRAGFVPTDVASGIYEGYRFELVVGTGETPQWIASAVPLLPARRRSFVVSHEGVIHFAVGKAIPLDPKTCAVPEWTQPLSED